MNFSKIVKILRRLHRMDVDETAHRVCSFENRGEYKTAPSDDDGRRRAGCILKRVIPCMGLYNG